MVKEAVLRKQCYGYGGGSSVMVTKEAVLCRGSMSF